MLLSNNEIRLRILQRLVEEPVFSNFKILKSDNSIVVQDSGVKRLISVTNSYTSVDTSRGNELSLEVNPWFGCRFDALEKWFETLFCRDWRKSDFKYRYSDEWRPDKKSEKYRKGWYCIDFLRASDTFEEDYQHLLEVIYDVGVPYLNNVSSLDGFYNLRILPVLKGEECFPDIGFDWIPRYLVLTKITHPEKYEEVKALILSQIDLMLNRKYPEPNVQQFEKNIPDIINYIETHDFSVEHPHVLDESVKQKDSETHRTEKHMTRAEAKQYNEFEKIETAVRRKVSKDFGWKQCDYINWKIISGYYFVLYHPLVDELELNVKPLFVDDLWWDIFEMPSNKQEPKSLRGIGAFAVTAPQLHEYKVFEKEDVFTFDESQIEATWKSRFQKVEQDIKAFLEENPDPELFSPENNGKYGLIDPIYTLMMEIHSGMKEKALDHIEALKAESRVTFVGPKGDAFEYVKNWCKKD